VVKGFFFPGVILYKYIGNVGEEVGHKQLFILITKGYKEELHITQTFVTFSVPLTYYRNSFQRGELWVFVLI
jgi:hypothetical protein